MHIKIINNIKLSQKYKKGVLRLKLNKHELNIIKILIKVNIIKFVKRDEDIFNIYLNYFNQKPIFQNITIISKPSKPVFISYKMLKHITLKYKFILIINTNKGVLTNFEALKNKLGGVLMIKL
jgi:ribosomal protein S8